MKVFVVAGEASGDRLGADLMHGLRHLVSDVSFRGTAKSRAANLAISLPSQLRAPLRQQNYVLECLSPSFGLRV